jgi:hypothetical protein
MSAETLLCPKCWKAHKDGGWYMSETYKKTAHVPDCMFHPTMTSWRVIRTLKSLRVWSLMGEGYAHPNFKAVRMTLTGGYIHRRTAEQILFDYEKPFIDLLVEEGYLRQHSDWDGVSRALEITPKGDELLRANLKSETVAA